MRKRLASDRLMPGRSDGLARSRDSNAGRAPIFRNVDSLHPFLLRLSECGSPKYLWSKSEDPLLGAWLFPCQAAVAPSLRPAFEQRLLALEQLDHRIHH